MENGIMAKNMEKEFLINQMGINMMENGLMAKEMVKEFKLL